MEFTLRLMPFCGFPSPTRTTLFLALSFLGALALRGPEAHAQISDIDFQLVWDSGSSLTDPTSVEAGDADLDGKFDFAGARSTPGVVHLYEIDGFGGYGEVWTSSPAIADRYVDLSFGDTDGDNLGEIFGARGSEDGYVRVFEQSGAGDFGFVHQLIQEEDASGNRLVKRVLIADTDLDGRTEVIVLAGGANPPDGLVAIWEHDGTLGENTYSRVYAYSTPSYIVSGAIGDSDHDGRPEIILGLHGFPGFPLTIRRIEYDPDQATWVHLQFTTPIIGLPITPHVADLDQDGAEELAFGSSGRVLIFENTGSNVYQLRFASSDPLAGDLVALDSRILLIPGTPTLVAGTMGGDLIAWSYDNNRDLFDRTYFYQGIGAPILDLALADDGMDELEELLLTVGGGIDQLRVYRRSVNLAAEASGAPVASTFIAAPNPLAHWTRLTAPDASRLTIHDVTGRTVRRLRTAGGSVIWDARDEAGRPVPRGVYWVRVGLDARTAGRSRATESFPITVTR